MKRRVILFFIMGLALKAYAQIDTTYIHRYDYLFSLRPYFSQEILTLNIMMDNEEASYYPNNPPRLGVDLTINNTIISVGYGYAFDVMRDKRYGRTKSFDFQMHNYTRYAVFDLYYQNYSGFYKEGLKDDIKLYPDLNIKLMGIFGLYVFNHKKYSYKAAFNQDERQIKSAGSFLLGIGAYKTKITTDSTVVFSGSRRLKNHQIGISAGYAYTWVIGRFWNVNVSGTAGLNFGNDRLLNFEKKIRVYPTLYPRLSAGYNRKEWALGFSIVGNMIYPIATKEARTRITSGVLQIGFVKRFDNIPFIRKRN